MNPAPPVTRTLSGIGTYSVAMADGWRDGPLPGTFRRSLQTHQDSRGAFREVWRSTWLGPIGVGPIEQVNESRSAAGVLRGLHFHLRQTDVWIIADGRAHVQLVDLREAIEGSGDGPSGAAGEVLEAGDCLVIPRAVAHGLWALTEVRMLYLVTNEYNGTDEHGFAWNDALAAAQWPAGRPVLSERDRGAPAVSDAIARARQEWQSSAR